MLSRRETLRGGTAVVAAIAGAGALAARTAIEDPILTIEREWQALDVERNQISEVEGAQYRKLPAWARAGQPGDGSGWPDMSDLPEFADSIGPGKLMKRPLPGDIRRFNLLAEVAASADPERLAEVKAEGRARYRAHLARVEERDRLYRDLGLDDLYEQDDALFDRQCAIEHRMAVTPALTAAGIAIKLRRWAKFADLDCDEDEHLVISALQDAERLAGEVAT